MKKYRRRLNMKKIEKKVKEGFFARLLKKIE